MASLFALKRSMSITLILVFGLLFGIVMGTVFYFTRELSIVNLLIGFIVVGLFILLQWALSGSIVAWSTRLQYLQPGQNQWLEGVVGKLAQEAGVPMPRLAIVNDPTPNAFVFGRTLKSSTLAVHTGLMENLNKDEIVAVLAHEIGHLKHKDVIVMTIASAIPLLCFVGARALLWGGMMGGGRRSSNNNAGGAIIFGIILMAVYVIAQLLVLRLSRMREFYADSFSAQATRDPHSLASALAKITYGLSISKKENPSGLRGFYIGDPSSARREIAQIMKNKNQYDLDGNGVLDARELELAMEAEAKKMRFTGAAGMFSTHPPTFKRILQLKEMENEVR